MRTPSLFGNLSVVCALLAGLALLVFWTSGEAIALAGEQLVVSTQIVTLAAWPALSLVGLLCSALGMAKDAQKRMASIGGYANALLLVGTVLIFVTLHFGR